MATLGQRIKKGLTSMIPARHIKYERPKPIVGRAAKGISPNYKIPSRPRKNNGIGWGP